MLGYMAKAVKSSEVRKWKDHQSPKQLSLLEEEAFELSLKE